MVEVNIYPLPFHTFAKKEFWKLVTAKHYHEYFFEVNYIAGHGTSGHRNKIIYGQAKPVLTTVIVFSQGRTVCKKPAHFRIFFWHLQQSRALQERKLLLNKRELRKLENKIKEKGYSIIPLKIFFTEKVILKWKLALGKGKKNYDKRETIKERETTGILKGNMGFKTLRL